MSKMMKNESITIDKRTLEFLLFSYFGKAKSAVEAAINVAYRDMAAHTLTKKANDERKDSDDWEKGKEITYDTRICGRETCFINNVYEKFCFSSLEEAQNNIKEQKDDYSNNKGF